MVINGIVYSQDSELDYNSEVIVNLLDRIDQSIKKKEPLSKQFDYYNYGLAYVGKLPEDHEARALLYENYTKFLARLGYYDEALKYGLALVSIIEDENYKGKYIHIYNDVGKIYLKLGMYDKAVRVEKEGLLRRIRLADQIDPTGLYHFLYNELGLTYFTIGEYDSAISYYDKALNSDFPFNDHFRFVLLENKAEAYVNQGDFTEARKVITTLKTHPGRYESDRRNINYYLLESEIGLLENKWKYAKKYLDSAYQYLIMSSEKEEPKIWNRYLTDKRHYFILKGNQAELSKFEREMQLFKDSLNLLSDRSIVLAQNSQFKQLMENQELRLKNAQLESFKNEAQLREEKLSSQNKTLLLIITILSFFIALVVLFRIYKMYRQKTVEKLDLEKVLGDSINKKNELEEAIKFKENDIQTLSNYLMGSSEQMNKLRTILKRINKIQDPEEKESLLLNFLIDARQKVHQLEANNVMLQNIEEINHEFHNRLLKKHPNLTKGELEYCGLIKSGFSNSEIAEMKNTSINTVKTAKYRLKKKMELIKSDKLDYYLNHL